MYHELQSLKLALSNKYRVVRRFKNNRVGVCRKIKISIPFSPEAFRYHFQTKIDSLNNLNGQGLSAKVKIPDLETVLGERWNIGQSQNCSTQARLIGDVSLSYKKLNLDIKQTSFIG